MSVFLCFCLSLLRYVLRQYVLHFFLQLCIQLVRGFFLYVLFMYVWVSFFVYACTLAFSISLVDYLCLQFVRRSVRSFGSSLVLFLYVFRQFLSYLFRDFVIPFALSLCVPFFIALFLYVFIVFSQLVRSVGRQLDRGFASYLFISLALSFFSCLVSSCRQVFSQVFMSVVVYFALSHSSVVLYAFVTCFFLQELIDLCFPFVISLVVSRPLFLYVSWVRSLCLSCFSQVVIQFVVSFFSSLFRHVRSSLFLYIYIYIYRYTYIYVCRDSFRSLFRDVWI